MQDIFWICKGMYISIYSNMCVYLFFYSKYVYVYVYMYMYIHMVCMYWHYRIYIYHIFFVLVQDTCCCLLLFTSVYRDDVDANGPSPRLHHNGTPHRWGARPAASTKERLAGWQGDQQGPKKMFNMRNMVIHHGILQATMVSVLISWLWFTIICWHVSQL